MLDCIADGLENCIDMTMKVPASASPHALSYCSYVKNNYFLNILAVFSDTLGQINSAALSEVSEGGQHF